MSTITDQLAGALRAITGAAPRADYSHLSDPFGVYAALAAYDDAKRGETPSPSLYNEARIRYELESMALGKAYFGNALRVALDMPGVDAVDRAVLNRWATGAQNDTDHIRLQEIAAKVSPQPLARPRIGIKVEGGAIQNVFADTEASIYVIDYDVEDAAPPDGEEDEDRGVCQLEQDGGRTAECVLSRYGAEIAPDWFSRMDRALAVHAAEMEEANENAEAPRP